MTETQSLEGAVALLREIRFGSPDMAREAVVAQAIDAFLALPSVSPDFPADAPGEGLRAVVQQYVESYIDIKTGVCRQCYAVPDAGHSSWCFIGKFIDALTSAPAPSSEALREALDLIDSMSPGLAYCLPVVQRAYKAFTDKHALAAEEAQ